MKDGATLRGPRNLPNPEELPLPSLRLSLAMQGQTFPIDMVDRLGLGVGYLELPRLLDKAHLPRLSVIVPIGKLAGLGKLSGRGLVQEDGRDQPVAAGHTVLNRGTDAADKRRAQQQHCYCPQARNGFHR